MTNPTIIRALPEILELEVVQGSTLGPIRHVLTDADDVPLDITGFQIRGQVRKKARAADVLATFDIFIVGAEGYYEFELTDEASEVLDCGDKLTDSKSLYEYDIEVEDLSGRVRTVLAGPLRVKAGVTRP